MSNKVEILFFARLKNKNKRNLAPIYARIIANSQRIEFSTGLSIDPKYWNGNAAKVVAGNTNAQLINTYISTKKIEFKKIYSDLLLEQKVITAEILKNKLLGIEETETNRTFLELMHFHNSIFKSKVGTDTAMTTYRKYMVTKKRLEEFILYHYKKKDINLSDLKLEFMASFDLYLKTVCKNNHNTVVKHCKNVKAIINHGIQYEWLSVNPFIRYSFKFWPKVCNVHIMSINCLLGNPGSNALDQSVIKSSYIDDLLEATDGKKVALFIDELHESIHNFEPSFIANLLRWKGRVQKTYIASATFTPATIPAIKAVSLLTDKNVHIYECERYKNNILADIYLHIIPSNSFGGKFLEIVDEQIQFHKGKKAINILTGLKYQANEIAKKSFKHVIDAERKLGKYPDNDSIHLLTSETELNFENGKNNIGTTFKTGSNITSQNSVLFIVLPTITNNVNNSHYGIFTDGIPSIVQSIGRLRNGGEIHIFTSEPSQSIDQANTTYPTEFLGKLNSNHYSQNAGYDILQGMYRNRLSTLQNEINIIEDAIINPQQPNQSIESRKSEFAIWYPNFHDFLMDKSQKTLVQGYPSFGKYINPYILWACLKDQFQNATLKEIIYHQPNALTINISTSNHCSVFQSVLAPLNNQIKNQSFRTFVNGFSDYLRCSTDEGGNILQNEYFFESSKRGIFSNKLMKEQTGFTKELLEEVIFIKTNKRNSLSKREYILSCLANIQDGGVYHEIKIREAYRKLLELREKFINWFQGKVISKEGNFLIPVKAYQELPEDLFSEAVETFTFLKENDKLVSTDVVSILQKLKGDFTDRNRGKVFKLLEELFINVTDQRVGNKKYSLLSDKNRVKNGCNPFLIRITA